MRRSRATAGLVALALPFALGCASGPEKSRFEREYQRYLSLPHQRVMAVAGDPEGRWVYGTAYSHRSTGEAATRAMEQCNVRKRTIGPDAVCRFYAIGNRVVWEGDAPE